MVTRSSEVKGKGSPKNVLGIVNPAQKRLYTLREAAEYLGRSEWGMRELIWAGEISVVRTEGGRKIFLDIQDLDNFIDRNKSAYL